MAALQVKDESVADGKQLRLSLKKQKVLDRISQLLPNPFKVPTEDDFAILALNGKPKQFTQLEDRTILHFFKEFDYASKLEPCAFTKEWKIIAAHIGRKERALWSRAELLLIGDPLQPVEADYLKSRLQALRSAGVKGGWAEINDEMEIKFQRHISAARLQIHAKTYFPALR